MHAHTLRAVAVGVRPWYPFFLSSFLNLPLLQRSTSTSSSTGSTATGSPPSGHPPLPPKVGHRSSLARGDSTSRFAATLPEASEKEKKAAVVATTLASRVVRAAAEAAAAAAVMAAAAAVKKAPRLMVLQGQGPKRPPKATARQGSATKEPRPSSKTTCPNKRAWPWAEEDEKKASSA